MHYGVGFRSAHINMSLCKSDVLRAWIFVIIERDFIQRLFKTFKLKKKNKQINWVLGHIYPIKKVWPYFSTNILILFWIQNWCKSYFPAVQSHSQAACWQINTFCLLQWIKCKYLLQPALFCFLSYKISCYFCGVRNHCKLRANFPNESNWSWTFFADPFDRLDQKINYSWIWNH